MDLLRKYTLIFFDLDGLLVNTEDLHFQAYQKMCKDRGFDLPWDFKTYCYIAHGSSEGLKEAVYKEFPALYEKEPNWSVLYAEKKKAYLWVLEKGNISLMPGVDRILEFVKQNAIRSSVVTNSAKELTDAICKKLPALASLPNWITREDYQNSKPSPDAYLEALKRHAKPDDKVIGFEDTVRGWRALNLAGIEGVVVSSSLHEDFQEELSQNKVAQFYSFDELSLS